MPQHTRKLQSGVCGTQRGRAVSASLHRRDPNQHAGGIILTGPEAQLGPAGDALQPSGEGDQRVSAGASEATVAPGVQGHRGASSRLCRGGSAPAVSGCPAVPVLGLSGWKPADLCGSCARVEACAVWSPRGGSVEPAKQFWGGDSKLSSAALEVPLNPLGLSALPGNGVPSRCCGG